MKQPGLFDVVYLRMTAWYVTIIMVISLAFSFWVYHLAQNELQAGFNRFANTPAVANGPLGVLIDERLEDSRRSLIGSLMLFNTCVLVAGAGLSYLLARRTMRPIAEAVDAQERFTADASHELRTPLAAMRSEIEVGLRDGKITKDEAVALLRSNLEEINRLGGLAEGLLTLTQTRDEPPALKPVSLEDIASRVAKRMQPLAITKQIKLERRLEPVIVQGDEASLEKIIGILLDNAIKYSPEDSTVTLATTQRGDGHGLLEVRDQGVGIKATELPHIFDRFYRADASRTKKRVIGHGLGLSIAHKLATQMNAKLEASSTPGEGSVFRLELSSE